MEQVERGAGHFAFRHQLIRDVAYSSLPRRERVRLHELAADEIHEHPGGRYAELAELRAFHLAEAAGLEPAGGRAEPRQRSLVEAGDFAVRRGAGGRGRELYEQAAEPRRRPNRTGGDPEDRRRDRTAALGGDRSAAFADDVRRDCGRKRATSARRPPHYARMVEVATRMGGVSGRAPEEESNSLQAKARCPGGSGGQDHACPASAQRCLDRLGVPAGGGDGRAGPGRTCRWHVRSAIRR